MDKHRGTAGERLTWDACYNVRDLGGYPTAHGRQTRWQAIVRADNLFRLTPAGRQALVDYGVGTIVDLRNPHELTANPNPYAAERASGRPVYRHLAFEDATDSAARAEMDAADTVPAIYHVMLARNQRRVGAVMEAIASAPDTPVLIHCHAGKDRTGLVVALLFHLVDVPNQTIAEDYALSTTYGQAMFDAWLDEIADPVQREQERQRWSVPVEIMRRVLDNLETDHGGAQAYLRAAGVSDTTIDRLRTRLLG